MENGTADSRPAHFFVDTNFVALDGRARRPEALGAATR